MIEFTLGAISGIALSCGLYMFYKAIPHGIDEEFKSPHLFKGLEKRKCKDNCQHHNECRIHGMYSDVDGHIRCRCD